MSDGPRGRGSAPTRGRGRGGAPPRGTPVRGGRGRGGANPPTKSSSPVHERKPLVATSPSRPISQQTTTQSPHPTSSQPQSTDPHTKQERKANSPNTKSQPSRGREMALGSRQKKKTRGAPAPTNTVRSPSPPTRGAARGTRGSGPPRGGRGGVRGTRGTQPTNRPSRSSTDAGNMKREPDRPRPPTRTNRPPLHISLTGDVESNDPSLQPSHELEDNVGRSRSASDPTTEDVAPSPDEPLLSPRPTLRVVSPSTSFAPKGGEEQASSTTKKQPTPKEVPPEPTSTNGNGNGNVPKKSLNAFARLPRFPLKKSKDTTDPPSPSPAPRKVAPKTGGTKNDEDEVNAWLAQPDNPDTQVFGVPVALAVERGTQESRPFNLPLVVVKASFKVREHMTDEGIFRLSGSHARIQYWKKRFDLGDDPNLNKESDPHVISGLLKLYLRELPESLLTQKLMPNFEAAKSLDDPHVRAMYVESLIAQLPEVNYALLNWMLVLLLNIISHSDTNKMNADNVALIFSPTLKCSVEILQLMMEHFDTIFQRPVA